MPLRVRRHELRVVDGNRRRHDDQIGAANVRGVVAVPKTRTPRAVRAASIGATEPLSEPLTSRPRSSSSDARLRIAAPATPTRCGRRDALQDSCGRCGWVRHAPDFPPIGKLPRRR